MVPRATNQTVAHPTHPLFSTFSNVAKYRLFLTCQRGLMLSVCHFAGNSGGDLMEFTLKDLYLIQRIQEEDQIFRLLVNSLCPAIYGHELVKAGLLLGLFGGRQKYANDVNRCVVVSDSPPPNATPISRCTNILAGVCL
jgi:hypothetical protein